MALNLPLTLPFRWQEEEELKELAEQGYSEDQLKMLYMVALYSHQAWPMFHHAWPRLPRSTLLTPRRRQ